MTGLKCKYKVVSPNNLKCEVCGRAYYTEDLRPDQVHTYCGNTHRRKPDLIKTTKTARTPSGAEFIEPRDADAIAYILETLCPDCRHYKPKTKTCQCGKCKRGTLVVRMAERGNCPAYRW